MHYLTKINSSTILSAIIQQPNVRNQRIGLITATCTFLFLAIKYVKYLKRNEKPKTLCDITKPSEIVILEKEEDCPVVIENLLKKMIHYRVVGLDCEWVYRKHRHPIALLQLATSNGYCVLIRLSKLSKIPPCLINFLEDSSIIKIGSAIKSDVHLLRSDYSINVFSWIDIGVASKSVGYPNGSLKLMAKEFLNVTLNKEKSVQCSNWEADELSDIQIEYAALDALMPVKIIEKIMKLKTSRQLDEIEGWNVFLNCWHGILNVGCHNNKLKLPPKQKLIDNIPVNLKQQKAISIKRKLYENCFLQDPNGTILCVCNNKKLDWYIERNLGVEISKSPRTVRLNFKPKIFERTTDSLYYMKEKENKCVVCGQTNSLRRKNVVPCEYRTHFPKEQKEYKSHDVVLLCALCHTRSTLYDQNLRQELIKKYDAPVWPLKLSEEGRKVNKLKYSAKALLMKNPLISSSRIEEIKSTIRELLNCEEITDEVLQEIKSMKVPTSNDRSMLHGEKVVKCFIDRNALHELEIMWRNHFITNMQPRHLPELWSVYHDPKNSEYMNFHKSLIEYK